MKVEDLTEALSKYLPDADFKLVKEAYVYSAKAHQGQSRRSGEAYISHPLEVANNLVKLKMEIGINTSLSFSCKESGLISFEIT